MFGMTGDVHDGVMTDCDRRNDVDEVGGSSTFTVGWSALLQNCTDAWWFINIYGRDA